MLARHIVYVFELHTTFMGYKNVIEREASNMKHDFRLDIFCRNVISIMYTFVHCDVT